MIKRIHIDQVYQRSLKRPAQTIINMVKAFERDILNRGNGFTRRFKLNAHSIKSYIKVWQALVDDIKPYLRYIPKAKINKINKTNKV